LQQRAGIGDIQNVEQRCEADPRPCRLAQLSVDRHLADTDTASDLEQPFDLGELLRALDSRVEDQQRG
jgi:hypothetical protein